MPVKRLIAVTFLLAVELTVLKVLPATTSHIVFFPDPDQPMEKARIKLGPVVWDMMHLSTTPALDAYRHFFSTTCPRMSGVAAAVCVSEALASRFAEDNPRHEWVDADYDPSAVLAEHLSGEPGHCVTRSGLAATALLSVGIPARVVQVQAKGGWLGHYAFEVLDGDTWHLVDPTAGSAHVSAFQLLQQKDGDLGTAHRLPDGANQRTVSGLYRGDLYGGMALYPEPWLYTRTGTKTAAWPYRATFLATGTPVPWLVSKLAVQWLLMPLTLVFLASLLLLALLRRGGRSRA